MSKEFFEIILDDEEWVDLVHSDILPGKYLISNYGRVYSKIRNRLLNPGVNAKGYVRVALNDINGKHVTRRINRLVALHFIEGRTEERDQVNHKDGIKLNNYYKNLEWTSSLENNRHAIENNLAKRSKGENHVHSAYSDEIVIRICELLERSYRGVDIAKTIIEEFPDLNYTKQRLIKYINDKVKKRHVRVDISSKYVF